jgi:hypothetical protein
MTKTRMILIAGALSLGAAYVAWPQTADDPLDSLKVCAATQHLIFENQFVRVIDDSIPVGVAEARHRHRHGVVVYLSDYTVEQGTDDGQKTQSQRKANTASWSDATIHTVRNAGTTPSHAIRIELK